MEKTNLEKVVSGVQPKFPPTATPEGRKALLEQAQAQLAAIDTQIEQLQRSKKAIADVIYALEQCNEGTER